MLCEWNFSSGNSISLNLLALWGASTWISHTAYCCFTKCHNILELEVLSGGKIFLTKMVFQHSVSKGSLVVSVNLNMHSENKWKEGQKARKQVSVMLTRHILKENFDPVFFTCESSSRNTSWSSEVNLAPLKTKIKYILNKFILFWHNLGVPYHL